MISRIRRLPILASRLWSWVMGSPVATYRAIGRRRDWVLAKIEYVNAEAAKWRTAVGMLKSPYSFLRMMGLSPQMAIGLLAVGSGAGSAVAIEATVFAEPSFAAGAPGV